MSRRSTTPEGAILKGALDLLRLKGIPAWRVNSGCLPDASGRPVRFGFVGCSDILGLLPPRGRLLALECKRPGGRPTPAQRAFLAAVEAAGGLAMVVDDLAALAAALDRWRAEEAAASDPAAPTAASRRGPSGPPAPPLAARPGRRTPRP